MTNPLMDRASVHPRALSILALARMYWPGVTLYDKQRSVVESVALHDETILVAANEVGKDFVAAVIVLTFFLCPMLYFDEEYVASVERLRKPGELDHFIHTRRIVTTSANERHLGVLWGEIGRLLSTSRIPLLAQQGGPLRVVQQEIRLSVETAAHNPLNYLVGKVSAKQEGLAGHHAAYTLLVGDEASGLEDVVHSQAETWAKKGLYFGNPLPTENFFRKAVDAGDLEVAKK